MKYDNIINEIDNLNAIDFTMDSFKTVGLLCRTINNMYGKSLMEKDPEAKVNYKIARGHLCKTVFDILKEKLGFEDSVINNMLCFIDFAEYIEDIYFFNDNILVKIVSVIQGEKKETIYSLPNDIYYEAIISNYNKIKLSDLLNNKSKSKK